MITTTYAKFLHYTADGATVQTVTMMGLSTDSKPTDASIGNGSVFIEMDTSKLYLYDAAGESWKEWGADASSSVQSNLSMAASPAVIRPNLGLSEPSVVEDTEPSVSEPEEEEPEEEEQEEQSEEEAR